MATATAIKTAPEEKRVVAISRDRMRELSHDVGMPMSITLEGSDTIEEGAQDVRRWEHIGPKLSIGQWLRISNDAETFYRFCEVLKVHGSPGTGLRALVLRDLFPPKFVDKENEMPAATGDYYVRWGGLNKKWQVIRPNGTVRLEGFNTESEAKLVANREAGNPKA
jgi:hypothetical protein